MNNKRSKASREEDLHILQFLTEQNIIQFGDRPDFLIDLVGKKVAIEHTRILRDRTAKGSIERYQESIWDQIVEGAKAFYVAEKHYNLCVSIMFNSNIQIKQNQVEDIARQLCDCIRELESVVIDSKFSGPFDWQINHSLTHKIPDVINVLWIEQVRYEGDLWSVSDGGAVGALKPEFIQFALDDKEKKIENYKTKCDELWLLLVISGGRMSSYFDSKNHEFLDFTYSSGADAVYLLDSFSNKVHKLLIAPQS